MWSTLIVPIRLTKNFSVCSQVSTAADVKLYLVVNNRVFDSIQSSELRLKGLKMLLKEIALEGI